MQDLIAKFLGVSGSLAKKRHHTKPRRLKEHEEIINHRKHPT
jgi:hypothetical protein